VSEDTFSKARILSLDCSENRCQVSLGEGERLVAFASVDAPRQHADLLLGLVQDVLIQAHWQAHQIQAVGVIQGPGAFTGIRIGISMAQGLAYGWGVPCLPLNTLEVLARAGFAGYPPAMRVLALLDARMGQVYAAGYLRGQAGWAEWIPACCVEPDKLLPTLQACNDNQPTLCLGSGLSAYSQFFQEHVADQITTAELITFDCEQLCISAFAAWMNQQQVAPMALDGLYLRPAVTP